METTNQGTWEDIGNGSVWTSEGVGKKKLKTTVYGFPDSRFDDPTVFSILVRYQARGGWIAEISDMGERLSLPINECEPLAVAKESALKCAKHYLKSLWEQIPEPNPTNK
jgi:hypothetical protein